MLKPIRHYKHSENVPEFFFPKGPFKSMAVSKQELEKKAYRRRAWREFFESLFVGAVFLACVGSTISLAIAWSGILA